MRDDAVYLQDILLACEVIEQHLAGKSLYDFERSLLLQDAVIRRFEVIGEPARLVADPLKLQHPGVPWALMRAMRNKLAHEYFGLSMATIYHTAMNDVPILKDQIARILHTLQP